MNNFVTLQISAKLFSGFTYKIPREIINNMSPTDIVNEVKIYMINVFDNYGLYIVSEEAKKLQLHIHDKLPFITNNTIYLCDHKY
jgi:hypothetical protein